MLNELTREQQLMVAGLIFLLAAGLGVMTYRRGASEAAAITISGPTSEAEAKVTIMIHVSGAVVREGVYRLESGDRIIDALELAGGATGRADLSALNLAEVLKDGVKVFVPSKVEPVIRRSGDLGPGDRGIGVSGTATGKISLNNSSAAQLEKIPGVGPSTAKRIVEHRQKNGAFTKLEDLMKVKGIGKGKFEKMKGHISI